MLPTIYKGAISDGFIALSVFLRGVGFNLSDFRELSFCGPCGPCFVYEDFRALLRQYVRDS